METDRLVIAAERANPLGERASAPSVPPVSSEGSATDLFDSVMRYTPELFQGNREALRESYVPSRLPHREHQIRQVAEVLAPALEGDVPSNLLIYGKIGTGKTAVVAQVRGDVLKRTDLKHRVSSSPSTARTSTRRTASSRRSATRSPSGSPTGSRRAGRSTGSRPRCGASSMPAREPVLLVLDEIDRLVARSGDGVLYTLCQVNTELAHARLPRRDLERPQVHEPPRRAGRSRLNEEKIVFPPYDAPQLEDILRDPPRPSSGRAWSTTA